MSDQQNLISQFIEITGVEESRAKFYLESSGWDLNLATASFFEGDTEGGPSSVEAEEEVEPLPSPSASKPQARAVPTPKAKFGTIASLKQQEEDGDAEEGQAFYAGGSEHSGQQVIGPGKKKKDFVAEMFRSVQEQGPEILAEPPSQSQGRQFGGTGYRLGQTDNDTEVIAAPEGERQTEVTLRLWKEGFSINDGELRSYTEPANAEFLSSIRRGVVPPELLREARGSEVRLSMVDNRHETYVPPRQSRRTFAGAGHTLGSPVPGTVAPAPPVATPTDLATHQAAAREALQVDTTAPTTNLQIRLTDGTRLVETFNQSHTVGDVRAYIIRARPQYAPPADFQLLTAFPSKELADSTQNLKDAGILNSAIILKLR